MLKIRSDPATWPGGVPEFEDGAIIATDDYYVERMEDGRDELHFTVQVDDPAYLAIAEETRIIETTENQTYVVKTIDAGSKTAEIGCQLDLSAWQSEMYIGYNSGSKTCAAIIHSICPGGWTVTGGDGATKKRTLEMDGPTPLDIIRDAMDVFGCRVRFDNYTRTAEIIIPENVSRGTAYAVDSVNLRESNFKGKSTDLYTRLYPIGKDGLQIGSINGGKPYVENLSYTKDTISKVWVDERYTDAQSLMKDAQDRVNAAARPVRSWELDVVDLYQLDAATWNELKMAMFDVLLLIDPRKKQQHLVQIKQQRVYPHRPEKNKIYVSTTAGSVQKSIRRIVRELTDANSTFYQRLKAAKKE